MRRNYPGYICDLHQRAGESGTCPECREPEAIRQEHGLIVSREELELILSGLEFEYRTRKADYFKGNVLGDGKHMTAFLDRLAAIEALHMKLKRKDRT